METNSNVIIKFDVFGNQLIFPESTERNEIIPIDKTEIKNDIIEELSNQIKGELDTFTTDIVTELSNKVKGELDTLQTNIKNSLKEKINEELGLLFTVSRNYIGFNKRRLVSVAEGKDNNDVVIMKQVKKMIEDNKLREKRDIEEDFENLFITKKELDNKIEKLSSVLITDVIGKVKQEQTERTKIQNKIDSIEREIGIKISYEINQVRNEVNEKLTTMNNELEKLIRLVMDEIVPKIKRLN